MKKTKALLVTDYFIPHWTGIVKSMDNVIKTLTDKIDFTVLTVQHDKTLKTTETNNNLSIVRTPYLFSFSRVKYSVSLLWNLLSLAKKNDVVFINSPCSNILPAVLISKFYGKKVVVFHQGDLILPEGLTNKLIEVIFDLSTKLAFCCVDKVSTYTEDYAKNSRVLKDFLAKFTPLIPPIPISKRRTNGNNENKITIGFGGRFVEEKGFDILIDAIPKVIEKLPKVHFVFAGETNMGYENIFKNVMSKISRPKGGRPLGEKIKNNLTILGLLRKDKLNDFFSKLDFVVIPSRSDCFPLFQAEAMKSGVPSIVSDIPGARYLVAKSGFGTIFEKENPDNLTLCIINIIAKRKQIMKNYEKLLLILDDVKNAEKFRKFIEE